MLAIVIAISALVLPSLDAGPARWDEARRAISMAAVEARADAMHDGRPVQLVAHAGSYGVELRTARSAPAGPVSDSGEARPLALGEALGTLPDGAKVAPTDDAGAPTQGPGEASPGDVVLVTILPGGQVTLAPGWELRFGDRRGAPGVNSWTGEVTFTESLASDAKTSKDAGDSESSAEETPQEQRESDRGTEPTKPEPSKPVPSKPGKPAGADAEKPKVGL